MATTLTTLSAYEDERGNRIEFAGSIGTGISILFRGANNVLSVADEVRFGTMEFLFDADDGRIEIGRSKGVSGFVASLRVGQDSSIVIGRNATSTSKVIMSAAEGTTVAIGDDVMFATGNQVRADDAHPIFDVRTGRRVNTSRDITIGSHVWLGWNAAVLGGSSIGPGSVVAMSAVVKGRFPNNCIIGGIPARVLRRDVAWERPHLTLTKPYYKPDANTVKRSRYWHPTADDGARAWPRRAAGRARRMLAPPLRLMGVAFGVSMSRDAASRNMTLVIYPLTESRGAR